VLNNSQIKLPEYSDYLVFVDESGDHNLENLVNNQYPVFVLAFCIIKMCDYVNQVVPKIQTLKLNYWGQENIIFHENDLRKDKESFVFFRGKQEIKTAFLNELNNLMLILPYTLIPVVIDKVRLIQKYPSTWNPYETALYLGMERLNTFLIKNKQVGKKQLVQFESRGKKEDNTLDLEFRKIINNENQWGCYNIDFKKLNYHPVFIKKEANITGIQIADLIARPFGLHYLKPEQNNRAVEILKEGEKIYQWKTFP
jgi:hypothetical protein